MFFRQRLLLLLATIFVAGTLPKPVPNPITVIGKSKNTILKVIQNRQKVFCFQDFFQDNIKIFKDIKYGSGMGKFKPGAQLINVEELNCVTLIENFMAMAKTAFEIHKLDSVPSNDSVFALFSINLRNFRYYLNQPATLEHRIHYFTSALYEYEKQGLIQNIAVDSGAKFDKPICFMSCNKKKYRGIDDWKTIESYEKSLSEQPRTYFPLEDLYKYEQIAQTGDIVALATNVAGLDVSHCGFISTIEGTLYFSHASQLQKKVVIEEDFCKYLANRTTITGIFVFRPLLNEY